VLRGKKSKGAMTARLVSAFLLASSVAAYAQNEDEITWDDVAVRIADARKVCAVESAAKLFKNPFDTYDPKAWRSEIKMNCWYPVFDGPSDYFIRVFDWGTRPSSITCAEGGCGSTPINIWVMGWHAEDKAVPYRRSLTLYSIRCVRGANRIAATRRLTYQSDGSLIADAELGSEKLQAAVPETKEDAFARAVCN